MIIRKDCREESNSCFGEIRVDFLIEGSHIQFYYDTPEVAVKDIEDLKELGNDFIGLYMNCHGTWKKGTALVRNEDGDDLIVVQNFKDKVVTNDHRGYRQSYKNTEVVAVSSADVLGYEDTCDRCGEYRRTRVRLVNSWKQFECLTCGEVYTPQTLSL